MTQTWPELEVASWQDTRDTFHMWTQIVGKIRMALEPMLNHWWNVTLYVSARGLTTSLMPTSSGGLEIEFDLLDEALVLRATDGRTQGVALEARTVASFYEATMAALEALDVHVKISARPNEVVDAIPFSRDTLHHSYDAAAVRLYWQQLLEARRVMQLFRRRFIGKASPVHYFWGGADLAVTRFSGRRAPKHPGGVPNCPDIVSELGYSHEVSSCGFWPGATDEGSFYSYAYPEPKGFADWNVGIDGVYYDAQLGNFILPYRAVRAAEDPDALLLSFLQRTYEAAAELGKWDRGALEADFEIAAENPA